MSPSSPNPASESPSPDRSRAAKPRVAFQGVLGAFGDEAVQRYWNGQAEALGAPTFDETVRRLADGEVDWVAIPVHNSTIGEIVPARRALAAYGDKLEIVDELEIPVHHCLLGRPGMLLENVRYVGSHPAALGQCQTVFTRWPHFVPLEAFDTAGSAWELAEGRGITAVEGSDWHRVLHDHLDQCAAIASARAARQYALQILVENVQDDRDNLTRFAIVRLKAQAANV